MNFLHAMHIYNPQTHWVTLHCVKSVLRQNTGKYGPDKTLYLDTFHAVLVHWILEVCTSNPPVVTGICAIPNKSWPQDRLKFQVYIVLFKHEDTFNILQKASPRYKFLIVWYRWRNKSSLYCLFLNLR